MNLCPTCREDFASVDAFDRHRVGLHAFNHSEGLALDPPQEDGRRCLDADQMVERKLQLDKSGRWRIIPSTAQQTFFATRQNTSSAQDSPPQSASDGQEVLGRGSSRRRHSTAPVGVPS